MHQMFVLLFICLLCAALTQADQPAQLLGHLKTSADGTKQREQKLKESAHNFLQGSEQTLQLPLEIDVFLLGFDMDGAFGYQLDVAKLESLLAALVSHEPLCPHVWDSDRPALLCYDVSFNVVVEGATEQTIHTVEDALKRHMRLVDPREREDGAAAHSLEYLVDGSEMEGILRRALHESVFGRGTSVGGPDRFGVSRSGPGDVKLGAAGGDSWHQVRPAIVLLNPHKRRMSPVAGAPAVEWPRDGRVTGKGWMRPDVTVTELLAEEGGYSYRYSYHGRGASSIWLSKHNFLVIDLSAGPVKFGPLSSPKGDTAPSDIPRLLPLLINMAQQLQSQPQGGQQRSREAVAGGQESLLLGGLAALLAAATGHLFAPDLRTQRLEYANRVLVPIIVMQDHNMFDLLSPNEFTAALDVLEVQDAVDSILGPDQMGVVTGSRHWMHSHPQIASALHRARSSICEAVLLQPPSVGMHSRNRVHIDSTTLLEELRHSADVLVQALVQNPFAEPEPVADAALSSSVRHTGTRVVPVFLFSLRDAPEQMLLDNRQLVATSDTAVVVLQLLGREDELEEKPASGNNATHHGEGRLDSGHTQNGRHVMLDVAESPTRSVVAGLAGALGGLVPPYQRYDSHVGRVVDDWRWAVGAQPWGPYSSTVGLSDVLSVSAQRHMVLSHVEVALRRLQEQMARIDAFVTNNLQGPFADISSTLPPAPFSFRSGHGRRRPPPPHEEDVLQAMEGEARTAPQRIQLTKALNPHRAWLNTLASKSAAYSNDTSPLSRDVVQRMDLALTVFEDLLLELGVALYTSEWSIASGAIVKLLREADAFTLLVDLDLTRAQEVLACCQMHHLPTTFTEILVLIGFILLCIAFVMLMLVGLCSQASRSRQSRRENGIMLPRWAPDKSRSRGSLLGGTPRMRI